MVWTDAVQGAARRKGWFPLLAAQRSNAPSRPSSRRVRTRIDAGQRCAPCKYVPLFDVSHLCKARTVLQDCTAAQADGMPSETPASPLPAPILV
jgi:hypothetical protein